MPLGFYTIERWVRPSPEEEPRWVVVKHLDGCHTVSDAQAAVQELQSEGFYRVIQTQRMMLVRLEKGALKTRRWHAMTPETLERSCAAYVRDPVCPDGG